MALEARVSDREHQTTKVGSLNELFVEYEKSQSGAAFLKYPLREGEADAIVDLAKHWIVRRLIIWQINKALKERSLTFEENFSELKTRVGYFTRGKYSKEKIDLAVNAIMRETKNIISAFGKRKIGYAQAIYSVSDPYITSGPGEWHDDGGLEGAYVTRLIWNISGPATEFGSKRNVISPGNGAVTLHWGFIGHRQAFVPKNVTRFAIKFE